MRRRVGWTMDPRLPPLPVRTWRIWADGHPVEVVTGVGHVIARCAYVERHKVGHVGNVHYELVEEGAAAE